MKTLGKLLGSAARTEILRVLNYQPAPIGLRQAARIARVQPRSAEVALKGLVAEGVVRKAPGPSYEIDRRTAEAGLLGSVFAACAGAVTRYRNRGLQVRARDLLSLMDEMEHLVVRARRSSHVPRGHVHGSH